MINLLDLRRRLKGRDVGHLFATQEESDGHMPFAYRFSNPNGRPYHDDWGIMTSNPLIKSIQPWQKVRRMDTTYLLPLPAKLVSSSGPVTAEWYPYQEGYPLSPGANVELCSWNVKEGFLLPDPKGTIKAFLTYNPTLPVGQSATFACYIDKEWVDCYYTSTFKLFGKVKTFNYGMKFDLTDPMWNFPEFSFSTQKNG